MSSSLTPPSLPPATVLLRRYSGLAGVFLIAFLLVMLSITLAREATNVAFIWLPNAFLFAVMMSMPARDWKWLLLVGGLANLSGNLFAGDSLAFAAGLTAANLGEILVGAVLVRRWILLPQPMLTIRGLLRALLIVAMLAIPLAALLGGEIVHQTHGTPRLDVYQTWWLGDAIGFLLLALPGLLLLRTDLSDLKRLPALLDFLFTQGVLLTISYLLLLFIPLPLIYICAVLTTIAFRDGALRTIIHANLVVLTLGALWWSHQIDLSHLLINASPKGLWAATALSCLFPALLGMAVEEMRQQQRAVDALTGRLRLASGALELGIWDWHVETGELHWNEQMYRLYDLPPGSPPLAMEQWRPRLHPHDLGKSEIALQAAISGEKDYAAEFRILTPSGGIRYIRAAGVVLTEGGRQRFVGVNWDVTPEQEALHAMQDAQIRLNAVINAASEFSIIATSPDGIIEVFSEGSERMLGYRAEELVNLTTPAPLHILDEVITRGIELSAEYDRPIEGFDVFVEKARQGESETREWTYVRKDGTRLPVKLVVTAIRDSHHQITGFLGIAQDITSQRKDQQAIITTNRVLEHQISVAQRARLEFENLFELAPGALLVVDKQGSIIKANTQSHDLFGYEHGDLAGRSIEELIPRDKRNAHVAHRNEFMRNPSPRLMASERVLSGMKKNGTQFLAEITLSPLLINGAPCTIAIARDVSFQKNAEKTLARAKEEAEAASKAKSDFLANMSHEIRTPLNAILGTAQLLEKTTLEEEARRYVKMIRTSGASLLGVINDVLDFSKIEAGKMELAHDVFELEDVLGSIANLMSISVGDKDIELVIGVAPGTPQRWVGDALRLNQILVNLVGNAIKFTEHGEVVVQLALQQRSGNTGILNCSVRDTGIGMNVEQQQRLFQAFSQADTSMTRRFGGTGLGLVICQRLIQMMGGTIKLASLAGVGTEFQFTLQLDIATEQPPALVTPATPPRRIMIVDDNKVSRSILASTIKQWGWQVAAHDNCLSAEQQLRQEQPYDAIVVDWKLSGHERLRQQQLLHAACKRILMVSAHGRRHHNVNQEQWDSVLIKPITASTLFDALNTPDHKRGTVNIKYGASATHALAGVQMLLVEDNELNQVVACGLLEQAGALIDVVENGQQAVEWLRKRPGYYRLVLMDVQMPVMDGFTATRLIRDELKLDLPIIAMSAGVMLAEQEQCLASGMNGFIAKPIDYQRMLDTILQHLSLPDALPSAPVPVAAGNAEDHLTNRYFSPDKMLSFVRGKPKRLRDVINMIETMIARGVAPIAEGHTLLLQGKKADATRYFHTLKGSMGNLGAQHMWDTAQALEHAIRNDETGNLEPLLHAATECLQKTVDAARLWLQQHPEYREQVEEAQPLTAEGLQQLRTLLAENNIQACDLFDTLRSALAAKLAPDAATALQNAMQALDFSTAVKLLEQISL